MERGTEHGPALDPLPATDEHLDQAKVILPLVLFDGECGFCASSVQFMLKHERQPVLKFAPQKGPTGQRVIAERGITFPHHGSVVLVEGDRWSTGSTASLRIAMLMGGSWRVLGRTGLLVPRALRDIAYRVVAKNRNRWRSKTTCALMRQEWRGRFLE